MADRAKKSASDLKLMIERELLAHYPKCDRIEVVISPALNGHRWSACILGAGPFVDQKCQRMIEDIATQLQEQFDLA